MLFRSLFTVDAQSEIPREPLWLAADTASEQGSVPQTEVQTVDNHTLDVTITFSGVWAQLQTGDGQSYTRLWHDEYSSYREPGQPALPGVTFNILVPQGAQVEVIQHKSSSHSVSLPRQGLPTKIIPAQRQASKSEPPPPWTPPDPARYASLSLHPQRWYEVKDTFQMRDYTILPLWINPARYRAANGELELLEKIELRLTWPESSATSLDAAVISDSPSFDRLVSQIVINPPPQATLDATKSGEGYLIITPDEFVEELAPFASMKISQGYTVETTLLSEISDFDGPVDGEEDDIIAIQNYIKSLDPPPVYLLLVGDTNYIPAPSGKITYLKTDLYYGTLGDETDFVPDIHVGRLPARYQADVINMVNKLVSYSNNGYQDWNSFLSFIATCDTSFNDELDMRNYQIAEGSHNYVINYYTAPLGFLGTFPELNPPFGGDQLYCVSNLATKDAILSRLELGRGVVIYSGHGAPNGWYDGDISIHKDAISMLANFEKYSFISSFACSTNDFGSESNLVGFGETWMIQESKGAIGYFGSAALSYWGPDDVLERNSYDSIFSNPIEPPPLRAAFTYGLSKVQENYPGIDAGEAQYYWETYNLLGDPSQQLWLLPEYQYEANAAIQTKDGLLNSTVRYPIEITNLGNIDSYTSSYENNIWPIDIDELVNLPFQTTATMWVNVTIPMDVVVGSNDLVNVTVSSTADPSLTSSFTFTTTALETFFTNLPVIMK